MLDLQKAKVQTGIEIGECLYLQTTGNLVADSDRRFLKSGSLLVNENANYPIAYANYIQYKKNYSVPNWQYASITSTGVLLTLSFANGYFFGSYVDFTSGSAVYYFAYSTDGLNWSNITNPFGPLAYVRDVGFGNGKYVVIGDVGRLAYADNPTGPWTTANSGVTTDLKAVWYSAAKNLWVVCGTGGWTSRSSTLTTWTALRVTTAMDFNDIVFFPSGYWYMVGSYNNGSTSTDCAYYSLDAISWTLASTGMTGVTSIDFNVTFGATYITNGSFVAYGTMSPVPTWTNITGIGSAVSGTIIVTDTVAMVVTTGSAISVTTDRINWSSIGTLASSNYQDGAYGNNRFVLFGGDRKIPVAPDDNILGLNTAIVDNGSTLYMRVK